MDASKMRVRSDDRAVGAAAADAESTVTGEQERLRSFLAGRVRPQLRRARKMLADNGSALALLGAVEGVCNELERDLERHNQSADVPTVFWGRTLDGSGRVREVANVFCQMVWDGVGLDRVKLVGATDPGPAAFESYMSLRKDWESVLGDLIPKRFVRSAEDWIYRSDGGRTALDDWPSFRRHVLGLRKGPPGLLTGLMPIDERLGGLRCVTVLGGETGVGKSALAISLSLGVLRTAEDTAVLYHSFELPKDTIYARLLSASRGIPYSELGGIDLRPTDDERKLLSRLRVVGHAEREEPGDPFGSRLKRQISQLGEASGAGRVLVVIDPLQKLPLPGPVFSDDGEAALQPTPTENQADEARVKILTEVQQWSRVPDYLDGDAILAVSEVRKSDVGRKRLAISDIRGSARIAYEAHAVLLLEQEEKARGGDGDVVPVVLNVAKARDGGRRGDIALDFHHTISTFRPREAAGSPAAKQPGKASKPARPGRFDGEK
jgi:hypothetical protein